MPTDLLPTDLLAVDGWTVDGRNRQGLRGLACKGEPQRQLFFDLAADDSPKRQFRQLTLLTLSAIVRSVS